MNVLAKEPAALIGLLAGIIVAVAQQVVGSGIVTGSGLQVLDLVISIVPVVAGLLIRGLVTPTTAPAPAPAPPAA